MRKLRRLWCAEQYATPLDPLTESWSDLSDVDAYAIAAEKLRLRNAPVVGYKLGFTSEAMRGQMGIADPNYGLLTSDLDVAQAPATIDSARLIHPLVEPEIGLLIGSPLDSGLHTADSVRRHVRAVVSLSRDRGHTLQDLPLPGGRQHRRQQFERALSTRCAAGGARVSFT